MEQVYNTGMYDLLEFLYCLFWLFDKPRRTSWRDHVIMLAALFAAILVVLWIVVKVVEYRMAV